MPAVIEDKIYLIISINLWIVGEGRAFVRMPVSRRTIGMYVALIMLFFTRSLK